MAEPLSLARSPVRRYGVACAQEQNVPRHDLARFHDLLSSSAQHQRLVAAQPAQALDRSFGASLLYGADQRVQ